MAGVYSNKNNEKQWNRLKRKSGIWVVIGFSGLGACLPTAFISFGCPKETEPKKKHHETQPEISFVAQARAARLPRNFRFARFVDVPRTCRIYKEILFIISKLY
jgi:hypothetical protein